MENFLPRTEFEEIRKSLDQELMRINKRLEDLELNKKEIRDIMMSVQEISFNIKKIADEQVSLKHDIEEMKGRDGEMWRKVMGYIATAIVGGVIAFLLQQTGLK